MPALFRAHNYNELQPASLTDDDFLKMLSIADSDALVVFIVNLFRFMEYDFGLKRLFVGIADFICSQQKVDLYRNR